MTYKQYLNWFKEQCKSPTTIQKMYDSKACIETDLGPVAYKYGQWCLMTADYESLHHAAEKKISHNHKQIDLDNQFVTTPTGRQKLNPDYIKRAQDTKSLRKKLQSYTGSPELASDILFSIHTGILNRDQIVTPIVTPTEKQLSPPLVPSLFQRIINLFKSARIAPQSENLSYADKQELWASMEKK